MELQQMISQFNINLFILILNNYDEQKKFMMNLPNLFEIL